MGGCVFAVCCAKAGETRKEDPRQRTSKAIEERTDDPELGDDPFGNERIEEEALKP